MLPLKRDSKETDKLLVWENPPRRTQSGIPIPGTPETSLKHTKCFNCYQKGHLARDCPEPRKKKPTHRIADGDQEEIDQGSDPWICLVATSDHVPEEETDSGRLPRRGPTYKVKVEIEGVRTRALLDHGAQVTIVRRQLLSHIREKRGWTLEQCHAKSLLLEGQPVGGGGEALGTTGIVSLKVQVVDTDVLREVPCYVLDSSKPLWNGEVRDCGIVIGTNALSNLGFNITHPNGTTCSHGNKYNSVTR